MAKPRRRRKKAPAYHRTAVVPGQTIMRRTTMWIDAELDLALTGKASALGVSRAAYIRYALRETLGLPSMLVAGTGADGSVFG